MNEQHTSCPCEFVVAISFGLAELYLLYPLSACGRGGCCIKKCDEVMRNSENETSESLPERAARGDGGAEIETMLCYNLNLLPGRYRLGVIKFHVTCLRRDDSSARGSHSGASRFNAAARNWTRPAGSNQRRFKTAERILLLQNSCRQRVVPLAGALISWQRT